MPKKKAKIDVTGDGKHMLFLEHDNVTDDASDGNLSDNESVDQTIAMTMKAYHLVMMITFWIALALILIWKSL